MKVRLSGPGWSEELHVRTGPLGREWHVSPALPATSDRPPASTDGWRFEVEMIEASVFRLTLDGRTHTITILPGNRSGQPLRFLLDDEHHELRVQDEADLLQEILGSARGAGQAEELLSPMPGIIRKILIEPGTTVEADEPLLILEAMKMENEVRAPVAGTVTDLMVREGETVAANQLLLRIQG